MNIKCEVIRDLLPLYVDGVASEESCALIEEHLEECEDCREYLKLLQEDLPEVSELAFADEVASLKMIKRRMRRNRILLVLVTLAFALIAGLVIHSQHLTEYMGSLDENLSYEVPAGYEYVDSSTDSNVDRKDYVRKSDNTLETISLYYDGLYETDESNIVDEVVTIDDETKVGIGRLDWDHEYGNELEFTIYHGDEMYTITYVCQETDKKNYYDSCSKEQETEMMTFIESFDYHRPDGSDLNVFQRLYRNLGAGGLVVLTLAILFFVGIPVAFAIGGFSGFGGKDDDVVISSKDSHASMNRERKAKGETSLPAINNVQGASSNNLARRDHSWNSVPDFFIKLFRKK